MELAFWVELSSVFVLIFICFPDEHSFNFVACLVLPLEAVGVALFDSIALKFVVFEGSLIDEVDADKLAVAVCVVELELSFIEGAILFNVDSFAVCLALNPLTKVNRSVSFVDFALAMRNTFFLDEDRTTLSSWPTYTSFPNSLISLWASMSWSSASMWARIYDIIAV